MQYLEQQFQSDILSYEEISAVSVEIDYYNGNCNVTVRLTIDGLLLTETKDSIQRALCNALSNYNLESLDIFIGD